MTRDRARGQERLTQISVLRVLLSDIDFTAKELAAECEFSYRTALYWIKALREEKLIEVAGNRLVDLGRVGWRYRVTYKLRRPS